LGLADIKSIENVLSELGLEVMQTHVGKHARPMLLRSDTQVIWVLLVCQTQVNVGPTQLLKFKNNKTIPKYLHDYTKIHKKNSVK